MSSSMIKITIIPNAYTLNVFNGIKCLCISSTFNNVKTLTYIAIIGYTSIMDFLFSYDHVPYTPIEIDGLLNTTNLRIPNGNIIVNFFSMIKTWTNYDNSYINSDIKIGFFNIEVEGYGNIFPKPDKDEIKCISFKVIGSNTIVLTTFSMFELQRHYIRSGRKETLDDYLEFSSELDMITYFIKECSKIDRIGGYNSDYFDWNFLLGRIKILTNQSNVVSYREKLNEELGRTININSVIVRNMSKVEQILSLSLPGLETFDLLPIVRRLFPYWPDYTLDTCAKKLINKGKSGFNIEDYFLLIHQYNQTKKKKLPLTQQTLELLEEAMIYSKVDTDILEGIYEKLILNRVNLTIKDWSYNTELEGFLQTRLDKTVNKLKLKEGFYFDVSVIFNRDFFLKCLSTQIKDKINTLKGNILVELPIFEQLYNQHDYFDKELYQQMCQDYYTEKGYLYVGNLGIYNYIANYNKSNLFNKVYDHDVFVVPSSSSWLSQENKTDIIETKGKAKLCLPMCYAIREILNAAISTIAELILAKESALNPLTHTEKELDHILFNNNFKLDDFVELKIVNLTNYSKYEFYLTEDERTYLKNRGDSVKVYYIETTQGKIRSYYPHIHKDISYNRKYYIGLLVEHLGKLDKLVGIKKF